MVGKAYCPFGCDVSYARERDLKRRHIDIVHGKQKQPEYPYTVQKNNKGQENCVPGIPVSTQAIIPSVSPKLPLPMAPTLETPENLICKSKKRLATMSGPVAVSHKPLQPPVTHSSTQRAGFTLDAAIGHLTGEYSNYHPNPPKKVSENTTNPQNSENMRPQVSIPSVANLEPNATSAMMGVAQVLPNSPVWPPLSAYMADTDANYNQPSISAIPALGVPVQNSLSSGKEEDLKWRLMQQTQLLELVCTDLVRTKELLRQETSRRAELEGALAMRCPPYNPHSHIA